MLDPSNTLSISEVVKCSMIPPLRRKGIGNSATVE
jgi:hypothetical protein